MYTNSKGRSQIIPIFKCYKPYTLKTLKTPEKTKSLRSDKHSWQTSRIQNQQTKISSFSIYQQQTE
jgi:hypothetical protein